MRLRAPVTRGYFFLLGALRLVNAAKYRSEKNNLWNPGYWNRGQLLRSCWVEAADQTKLEQLFTVAVLGFQFGLRLKQIKIQNVLCVCFKYELNRKNCEGKVAVSFSRPQGSSLLLILRAQPSYIEYTQDTSQRLTSTWKIQHGGSFGSRKTQHLVRRSVFSFSRF